MVMKNLIEMLSVCRRQERGSEVTEQVFWIGLIILAIVVVLPQLREALVSRLSELISALGQ